MATWFVVIILLLIDALRGEIVFKEYSTNQVYYPTFIIEGLTGACGLFVCETCIKLLTYTGNAYQSNQFYVEPNSSNGHRYAWDYPNTPFVAPLSFEITKSNNEKMIFSNIIPNWGTTRTFPTGRVICPTPSPTHPTEEPTPAPTNVPTVSPSDDPSISPTTSQPTHFPTNNPTITPTTSYPTIAPTLLPTKYPSSFPSVHPTTNPTMYPSVNPSPQPTLQPSLRPTLSPNNNNGFTNDVPTATTTNVPSEESIFVSSFLDETTLIILMSAIVGVLLCLVGVLLFCYYERKRLETMETDMELGRIASKSEQTPGSIAISQKSSEYSLKPQFVPQQSVTVDPDDVYGNEMTLKLWLNNCGLSEYYQSFVNEGFHKHIGTISRLNDEKLHKMGVSKLAHREALLEQIEVLKMAKKGNYKGIGMMQTADAKDEEKVNAETFIGEDEESESSTIADNMYIDTNAKVTATSDGQ